MSMYKNECKEKLCGLYNGDGEHMTISIYRQKYKEITLQGEHTVPVGDMQALLCWLKACMADMGQQLKSLQCTLASFSSTRPKMMFQK